jgi:hypothetical protein
MDETPSRRGPVILALVGIAVAVALFFILKEDEPAPVAAPTTTEEPSGRNEPEKPQKPEKPEVPQIELTSGEPAGGVSEIEVKSGDQIAFEVTSDVDDEVHVHGYDVEKPLPAGKTVSFEIPATIEGVFEVESHDFGTPIAEISVVP